MEIWKDIIGYEGYYEVSNKGRVRSKYRILKPQLQANGYYTIRLSKNNIVQMKRVHRLVAETFIENRDNKKQVNHIDGNKLNNVTDNLEWVTPSENTKHSYDNNLQKKPKGELNSQAKLTWEKVREITKLKDIYSRKELAQLFNVSVGTIGDIINERTWKE